MFINCLPDPEFEDTSEPPRISPMDYALMACEQIVRQQIRTTTIHKVGQRNAFGILLYDTVRRKPHVFTDQLVVSPFSTQETPPEKAAKNLNEPTMEDPVAMDQDDEEETDNHYFDDTSPHGGGTDGTTTVHEFVPLKPPGIQTVRRIQLALDDVIHGRRFDVQAEYGHPTNETRSAPVDDGLSLPPLEWAFHEATQLLVKCGKKNKDTDDMMTPQDVRQICIFTNNDNPCCSSKELLDILKHRAQDVLDNEIEIIVWPFPKPNGKAFDYSLFYDCIGATTPAKVFDDSSQQVSAIKQEDGMEQNGDGAKALDTTISTTMGLETLVDCFISHVWKKARRSDAIVMLLPDWKQRRVDGQDVPVGIMVDLFKLIKIARTPAEVVIHQQTGRALSKATQMFPAGGGDILFEYRQSAQTSLRRRHYQEPGVQDRIRTYCSFGNDERVPMSHEDMMELKRASNATSTPSLIILGFKSVDDIPFYHMTDSSYFMYPNDEMVEGSCVAFANLHASMIRKGVVAIGELLTRTQSSSRLVAVYPIPEKSDGEQETTLPRPSGMLAVPLPFEDWIRAVEPDAAARATSEGGPDSDLATDELIRAFEDIVRKQTLQDAVIGEDFENAYLSDFWKYVERIALDEPAAPLQEYDTIVDEELVSKLVGREVETILSLLPEDVVPTKEGRKRDLVPDDSGIDWQEKLLSESIDSCTAVDLKKYLRSVGAMVSGRKGELVDRVTDHLRQQQPSKRLKQEDES